MIKTILPLLVALSSGMAMAFQGAINTGFSKIVGLLQATFIVHVSASLILAMLLLWPALSPGSLVKATDAPWYLLLGGPLSVLIVYTVVFSMGKIGVAPATTAIIVGQVLTALMIDHQGLFGLQHLEFGWWQLLGLALFALGAKLLLA